MSLACAIAFGCLCVPAQAGMTFRPVADAHVGKHGTAGTSRALRVGRGGIAYLRFAPNGVAAPVA
jgi:hypothetical protein